MSVTCGNQVSTPYHRVHRMNQDVIVIILNDNDVSGQSRLSQLGNNVEHPCGYIMKSNIQVDILV